MNEKEITELYLRIRDKEASEIPSAIWVNGVTLPHRCLFLKDDNVFLWEEQRRISGNRLHIIPVEAMNVMIETCVPKFLPINTPRQKIEAVSECVFSYNASTWKDRRLPIEATELIMVIEL